MLWLLGTLIAVSSLNYWEQSAALYVLSTLAMTLLLVLVAFADLEGKDKEQYQQTAEGGD